MITKSKEYQGMGLCSAFCKGCFYHERGTNCCGFILIEGHSRGCPPNEECTRRVTAAEYKAKKRKERNDKFMEAYALGLTDVQMAEALGVSRTTVSRWRDMEGLPYNTYRNKPADIEIDMREGA